MAGIDPESGENIRLFNPRTDDWVYHFQWKGPELIGLTAAARATIETLRMNHPDVIFVRAGLIAEGVFDVTSEFRRDQG